MSLKEDSQYDSAQVLPRVYDNNKGVLKVWPTDGEYGLKVNPDGSINVVFDEGAGVLRFDDNAADSLPDANSKVCYTLTSVSNTTHIDRLDITASAEVIAVLKVDGIVKRQARTSPGNRNSSIEFSRALPLPLGAVLTVELKITNIYNTLPVDTFVSLEGYTA